MKKKNEVKKNNEEEKKRENFEEEMDRVSVLSEEAWEELFEIRED